MNVYLQLGAFGLLAWIVKRMGDAVASRLAKGDGELVSAINEVKNLLVAQREETRFLRESFSTITSHLSDLLQRWKTADAIHELHNQEQSEVHSMTADVHRAVVDRPTGVHRRETIERTQKSRAAEREEILGESQPPRRER